MTKTDTILEVPEMQVSAIGDTLELRTEGLFKKYGKAPKLFYFRLYLLTYFMKVRMTRNKLSE